ncbi:MULTISPECIES: MFS transporter [unclassified Arcicella]|uniref:MFS transporter n=1 Tax=unclassified Arcicella TaxID=2644986 RepID=UPI0028647962|nr:MULTISPECIES: MFS transporter [unclassified Arcicella]MDR6560471.1 MFS family permease [Arcicella sp. BE51]MDR6809923.1 MFS family permease [Arcicella sp. BE140]MDR6821272.1 MFS family permease [Arcicella sp. BE139]
MSQIVNRDKLFLGSCFALITTAMAFGIRAGVLTQLGAEFQLSSQELGYVNQMAFLGFPIAMIIGGPLYNALGPKKIIWVAFFTHVLGLVMTIFSGGFWTLLISTFFVGFGNGTVEAACNPMISDMYEGNEKTKMLNRFHMWFPGGIVIGSLLSQFMTSANMGWQLQIGAILIPAVGYAFLFFGQSFPASVEEGAASTGENLKSMLSPLYLFMLACMALTAISEFGPEQWIGPVLGKAGASPMIILALVTGLMAVGRYFAGPIVHSINPTGVLLASAIFTTIGVILLSQATGGMVYVSAVIFAVGVCYFWPTMIGFVAENLPRTGAFGLSIMGGMGMFSTSIFQPIIGSWIDDEKVKAAEAGLTGDIAELTAGQATLVNMTIFPAILIFAFIGLYFYMRKRTPAYK